MDSDIKNATIYFLTPTNMLLLVRLARNNKLTTPGGRIEHNEHPYMAALREFREETGFCIDSNMITSQYSIVLTHTAFFFIRSNQRFGTYKRENTDGETNGMTFMHVSKLQHELYHNANAFMSYFVKYTKKLFDMQLLNN